MSATVENLSSRDMEKASDLILKFWSLNSEFEPDIELKERVVDDIMENLKTSLADNKQIVLVARTGEKLIGLLRAEITDNWFYGSKALGKIIEFYVLPAHRRSRVGETLLNAVVRQLSEKGIELVTAEFPSQNVVATGFYEKNGFSPFFTVYVRKTQS